MGKPKYPVGNGSQSFVERLDKRAGVQARGMIDTDFVFLDNIRSLRTRKEHDNDTLVGLFDVIRGL